MYFAHMYQEGNEVYGGHMMGYGWDNGIVMAIWMSLWLALLVAAAVIVVRMLRSKSGTSEPLDELKRRYARGEIDRKTFNEIKKDISTK